MGTTIHNDPLSYTNFDFRLPTQLQNSWLRVPISRIVGVSGTLVQVNVKRLKPSSSSVATVRKWVSFFNSSQSRNWIKVSNEMAVELQLKKFVTVIWSSSLCNCSSQPAINGPIIAIKKSLTTALGRDFLRGSVLRHDEFCVARHLENR